MSLASNQSANQAIHQLLRFTLHGLEGLCKAHYRKLEKQTLRKLWQLRKLCCHNIAVVSCSGIRTTKNVKNTAYSGAVFGSKLLKQELRLQADGSVAPGL